MNVKEMNLHELETCFNLTSKIRESLLLMARADNNKLNTEQFRSINEKYNLVLSEVLERLNTIYSKTIENKEKEVLNEEVVH